MTKQICKFVCLAFIAVTLFGCSSKTGDEKTGNGNGNADVSQLEVAETVNHTHFVDGPTAARFRFQFGHFRFGHLRIGVVIER